MTTSFRLFGFNVQPIPLDQRRRSDNRSTALEENPTDGEELAVLSPENNLPAEFPKPTPLAEESDGEESAVLSPEPMRVYLPPEIRMPGAMNSLPAELLQRIIPARPVLLYVKKLTNTDVDDHQNRLLVTETDKLNEFLTEEEREMAEMDVKAVDVNGREFELTLAKRGERRISVVLRKKWGRMLRDNQVEALDFVHVWGFRQGPNNEFRLALVFTKHWNL